MVSVLDGPLSSSVLAEGLEMSHFCHFWAFWPLSQWNAHWIGFCHDSFALNLSLSGRCLPSHTSVAQGMLCFAPWWTLLYAPWWTLFYCGSLPWRSLLYLWGMIWMSGHHSSLSAGCWAVCGLGRISASPPLSFLKWNLRHLLVPCHFSFSLPWPNCWRSWNDLCWFYV